MGAAGVLEVVEQAAGGQPEGLPGERHGGQAGLLAGADERGEVHVRGEVLLADQDEGVAVEVG